MTDDYARHLLRIAIAQQARGLDIQAAQPSALDTMSDVVQLCKSLFVLVWVFTPTLLSLDIEELGFRAHQFTEHAGRTHSNHSDVLLALSHMGVDWHDLSSYCKNAAEIPFPKGTPLEPVQFNMPLDVPQFPVKKDTTTQATYLILCS